MVSILGITGSVLAKEDGTLDTLKVKTICFQPKSLNHQKWEKSDYWCGILKTSMDFMRRNHIKKLLTGDFSGGPVVKTPSFQCRGYGFAPWSGN